MPIGWWCRGPGRVRLLAGGGLGQDHVCGVPAGHPGRGGRPGRRCDPPRARPAAGAGDRAASRQPWATHRCGRRSCWPGTPSACGRPVRGGRCGSGRCRTARAVLEADPSRAEQAAADTRAERRVWHTADTANGHGVFGLVGPVQETAACHAAVDALARRWQAEGRAGTLDQLRFDAAVGLLTGAEQHPGGGGLVGQVTIPLSSLVGVDDAPGELTGVGPIPASVARELMAEATVWRATAHRPGRRTPGYPGHQAVPAHRGDAPIPAYSHRRRLLRPRLRPPARSAGGSCRPGPGRPDQHHQPDPAVPGRPQRQNPWRLGARARPGVRGRLPRPARSAAVTPPRRPRRSRPLDVAPTSLTCGLGSRRSGRCLLPHRRTATGSR